MEQEESSPDPATIVDDVMAESKKNWYTPLELADDLGVNYMTIIKALNAGEIPAFRVGRQWRIYHKVYRDIINKAMGISSWE